MSTDYATVEDPDVSARVPTALTRAEWGQALKRTFKGIQTDNLTDWAASLTYYGILALFPALLVLMSMIGLLSTSATQTLIDHIATAAPGSARDVATNAVHDVQGNAGGAGLVAVISVAGALWAASGYVGAFMRASNAIWAVEEDRPFTKTVPLRLAISFVALLIIALGAAAVVITGPVARQAGDIVGAGSTAVQVWDIAKWPILILIFSVVLSGLYSASPNVRQPGWRWVTPGSLLAVAVWIVASVLFALYVSSFASYNATYGSIAGVIVFLVWLWITNLAILLGAELNAELQREREVNSAS